MIKLIDIVKNDSPSGSTTGKKAYQKILTIIEKNPQQLIFEISFADIKMADSTFLRESIVSVGKQLIAQKAIFVTNIDNKDIIDNLNYAAINKMHPIFVWKSKKYQILGPKITTVTKEFIDAIIKKGPITAADIASKSDITARNASVKLNKLFKDGFVFRDESVAATGGREFLYKKIK